MIKIVATQVDPEEQESPLSEDDFRMQEVVLIGDYNRKSGSKELIDFIDQFEQNASDLDEILHEGNELLTSKEREYLKFVFKPFANDIMCVQKMRSDDTEYIVARTYKDSMIFPYFTKGTMYKGMKPEAKYELKELGIEYDEDSQEVIKEMTDYFDLSSAYGPDYTPSSDVEDWKKAIDEIEYTQYEEYILTCLTDRKYARTTIKGCSQSEWATLIYPADWTADELSDFEIEYFNLGTEWSLDSEDYDSGATYFYTHTFADEKAKEEMADFFGVDKEEIQLKVLEGYKKIPEYRVL